MAYAIFTCPDCDAEQDPMLHTVNSSCGGAIEWRDNSLHCASCDMEITEFRCDECGAEPDEGGCAS